MKVSERLLGLLRVSPEDLADLAAELRVAEAQVEQLRILSSLVAVTPCMGVTAPAPPSSPALARVPDTSNNGHPARRRPGNGQVVREQRARLREYLLAHGPSTHSVLMRQCGFVSPGSLARALACPWFEKTEGGYALTAEGRGESAPPPLPIPAPALSADGRPRRSAAQRPLAPQHKRVPPRQIKTGTLVDRYRAQMRDYLRTNGPTAPFALARALDIPEGSIHHALKHPMFERQDGGKYALVPGQVRQCEDGEELPPPPPVVPENLSGDDEARLAILHRIAKAGPQRSPFLAEIAGVDLDEIGDLLAHKWFTNESDGWHLTALGWQVANAKKEG